VYYLSLGLEARSLVKISLSCPNKSTVVIILMGNNPEWKYRDSGVWFFIYFQPMNDELVFEHGPAVPYVIGGFEDQQNIVVIKITEDGK